jgi:hypothetical protein
MGDQFQCTTSLLFATSVFLGIQRSGLNQGNWLPIAQIVVLPTSKVLNEMDNLGIHDASKSR